jgi:signal transduction histidine kinase
MVRETASELSGQGLDIKVTRTQPTIVRTGRLALSRALRNLLINAATHGVRARVSVEEREDRAHVTIVDEGPGIPEALIGRVFEPFFRVDPARRQSVPGAGLGLTIAHEIVQRAGGTIRIRNAAGGGLEQTVQLPRAPSAAHS